jgi:hypothetical protein
MAMKEKALARAAARRYWREDDARVLIEAWQRSGLTLVAFAESHDVLPKRLARWVARLRKIPSEPVGFHPVRLVEAGRCEGHGVERIEVILGAGVTVRIPRGFAPEDLRQVLAVLEGRAPC